MFDGLNGFGEPTVSYQTLEPRRVAGKNMPGTPTLHFNIYRRNRMFSQEQEQKLATIAGDRELLPYRLQDRSPLVIALALENGRGQRFLGAPPSSPPGIDHSDLAQTIRELRWEGFVDVPKDDVDGDGILDDILQTGWKTTDSGMEFLRRLKEAAGI